MLEKLDDLIELLAREPLTVTDVTRATGTLRQDYGGNLLVQPRDADFTEIDIVRRYQSDAIAAVILTLRDPLSPDTLEQRFGTPRRTAREERQPAQLLFYLPQPDRACDIVLMAALSGDSVIEITLRRDRH